MQKDDLEIALAAFEKAKTAPTLVSNSDVSTYQYTYFFSHNSKDQPFVTSVYDGLILMTKNQPLTFKLGEPTEDLHKYVQQSQHFVYFLSKNSLAARWCHEELATFVKKAGLKNEHRRITIFFFGITPEEAKGAQDASPLLIRAVKRLNGVKQGSQSDFQFVTTCCKELMDMHDPDDPTDPILEALLVDRIRTIHKSFTYEKVNVTLDAIENRFDIDIDGSAISPRFLAELAYLLSRISSLTRGGHISQDNANSIDSIMVNLFPSTPYRYSRRRYNSLPDDLWKSMMEVGFGLAYDAAIYLSKTKKHEEKSVSIARCGSSIMSRVLRSCPHTVFDDIRSRFLMLLDRSEEYPNNLGLMFKLSFAHALSTEAEELDAIERVQIFKLNTYL